MNTSEEPDFHWPTNWVGILLKRSGPVDVLRGGPALSDGIQEQGTFRRGEAAAELVHRLHQRFSVEEILQLDALWRQALPEAVAQAASRRREVEGSI